MEWVSLLLDMCILLVELSDSLLWLEKVLIFLK